MIRKTLAAIALLAVALVAVPIDADAAIYRGWVITGSQPPPMPSITIESAQGIDFTIAITNEQFYELWIISFPTLPGTYVTVKDMNNDMDTKDANESVTVIPPN